MLKKLNEWYCKLVHQYLMNYGYMSEKGWHVCAECYTKLSRKAQWESEND